MSAEHQLIRVGLGRPSSDAAPRADGQGERPGDVVAQTPAIDIHEGADGLILEADLPGATEDTVSVEIEDNVLMLRARVAPLPPDALRTIHEESRLTEYQRSFILSDEVDRAEISAEMKNGVLRLILPKAERAKTRRIEIKAS